MDIKSRVYTFAIMLMVAAMLVAVWKLLPGH